MDRPLYCSDADDQLHRRDLLDCRDEACACQRFTLLELGYGYALSFAHNCIAHTLHQSGRLCDGERVNFWIIPFFTAPIGGLALLGLILTVLVRVLRK